MQRIPNSEDPYSAGGRLEEKVYMRQGQPLAPMPEQEEARLCKQLKTVRQELVTGGTNCHCGGRGFSDL